MAGGGPGGASAGGQAGLSQILQPAMQQAQGYLSQYGLQGRGATTPVRGFAPGRDSGVSQIPGMADVQQLAGGAPGGMTPPGGVGGPQQPGNPGPYGWEFGVPPGMGQNTGVMKLTDTGTPDWSNHANPFGAGPFGNIGQNTGFYGPGGPGMSNPIGYGGFM